MPEGPEIYISSLILDQNIRGQYITSVTGNWLNNMNITGQKINNIHSVGKKMIITLDTHSLVISFGLTGVFKLYNPQVTSTPDRNVHLVISLSSGLILKYYDQLKFGSIKCVSNDQVHQLISGIGIDLMSVQSMTDIDINSIHSRAKRCKTKDIADFISDQKYMAGVGNYVRSDALYLAGVHPNTLAKNVSIETLTLIIYKCIEVMRRSASVLGSSGYELCIPSENGTNGGYVHLIYGKKLTPCGRLTEQTKTSDGRNTWFCPDIQKM